MSNVFFSLVPAVGSLIFDENPKTAGQSKISISVRFPSASWQRAGRNRPRAVEQIRAAHTVSVSADAVVDSDEGRAESAAANLIGVGERADARSLDGLGGQEVTTRPRVVELGR